MKLWKTTIQQRKKKVLIVFDDMIADMEANKILSPIVIELFMKGRKLDLFQSSQRYKTKRDISFYQENT